MAMKMCIAVLFIVCFLQLWFHCVHSAWSVIYLVKLLNTVIFVYRGNAFFFSKQCKSLPTQNILFWNGVIHSVCYIIPHDMALPLHSLCLCSLHSIIISPGSLHVGSHSYDSILHGYLKSCKFKLDSNQRTVFSFKTTIWKVANPDWGWNKKNTLPLSHLPLNSATSRSSSFLTIPCKAHNILRLLAIVCCKCKPNPS